MTVLAILNLDAVRASAPGRRSSNRAGLIPHHGLDRVARKGGQEGGANGVTTPSHAPLAAVTIRQDVAGQTISADRRFMHSGNEPEWSVYWESET